MTTRSITQGGLTIALTVGLLLIARQFATTIDVFIGWVLPLPLIMYGARFKPSHTILVLSASILLSFIVSPLVSALYFMFYFMHGAIFGIGLYLQWGRQRLFISSMLSMALVTFFSVTLFSQLFGIDLMAEYSMIMTQLVSLLEATGTNVPANIELGRIALVAMALVYVFTVILEGWVVYVMALLLAARLKYVSIPPRIQERFQLPKWAGIITLVMILPYPFLVATNTQDFLIPAISLYVLGVTAIVYNALNFVIILKRRLNFKYFYVVMIVFLLLLPSLWLDIMLIVGLLDSLVNLRQRW